MPINIAVTDLEYRKAYEIFSRQTRFNCLCAPTPENELADFIRKNAVVRVIVGVEKYTGELYRALPPGAVIARFGVGHDGIDKKLAGRNGLFCTNTPGALNDSVAECAIALMLACARELNQCAVESKANIWQSHVGLELKGKTLTIIGCGAIGRETARMAKSGFGMRTVGYDLSDAGAAAFVSLHIPDLPSTRNFINHERLGLIPGGAILINTARGNIVDEDALYDALVRRRLKAAGLDVFKNEPYIPQSPGKDLRTLANVLMTSHIASSTGEACGRMAESALRNIQLRTEDKISEMNLINRQEIDIETSCRSL
mgnify:CR=1 FL=1